MSRTFYDAPNSTASTVHWSLEELGVPYEGVQVDLQDDADKLKKLVPVNPNQKVPVLVADGTPIFDGGEQPPGAQLHAGRCRLPRRHPPRVLRALATVLQGCSARPSLAKAS